MDKKKPNNKFDHLKDLYYDPHSTIAYSNANYIYNFLKEDKEYNYSLKDIKTFLRNQDVHTTHSEKRLNKRFARVYANKDKYQYDVDTAFYKEGNSKFSKFVIFVDVFSRYTHAEPINNLKADNIVQAFKKGFKRMGKPLKVRSDRGREYINRTLKSFLEEENVEIFPANIPHKANYAEAHIKQLKKLLTKLSETRAEKDWTKVLHDALLIMNNRKNRSINMSPIEARKQKNQYKVLHHLNKSALLQQGEPISEFAIEVNSPVRVRTTKGAFSKSHEPSFSEEIFFTVARKLKDNIEYYFLKSEDGELIDGAFTLGELLPIPIDDNKLYRIEKVLKKKKRINGIIFRLVKWLGYKTPSYVPQNEIKKHR